MFPIATTAGGTCSAFPDVCLVPSPAGPAIPTPFVDVGDCTQADGAIESVRIGSGLVVVEGTRIPKSTGNGPGTAGGVVSGVNRGEVVFREGSAKVRAKGKRVAFLTSRTAHNGANANAPMGAVQTPSQSKVVV